MRGLYGLPAPAKLNLFLHVVGRRDDGYHLLQSLFVLIDWADELHVERRDDGQLRRHDLTQPLPADDLCLRAARALQQASGSTFGVDLSIDKQVPWGAGMGGGSSDAATTLLALNRLWGLHWPRDRLAALALQLGADVPFFVGGHNAFVEGIGERLTPVAATPQPFVVVKPPVDVPTAAIFGSPDLKRDTEPATLMGSFAGAQAPASRDPDADGGTGSTGEVGGWFSGFGRNDLQPVAERRCSEVAQAADWLQQRYGNSRMTGSGSAVFARVGTGDGPEATFPAGSLPPGWVGRLCRSLPRHPLVDWAG